MAPVSRSGRPPTAEVPEPRAVTVARVRVTRTPRRNVGFFRPLPDAVTVVRHWRAIVLGSVVLPAAFWGGGWLALETETFFYPFLIRKTLAGLMVTVGAHHAAFGFLTILAVAVRDPTLGR